jgi:hypothetical protein
MELRGKGERLSVASLAVDGGPRCGARRHIAPKVKHRSELQLCSFGMREQVVEDVEILLAGRLVWLCIFGVSRCEGRVSWRTELADGRKSNVHYEISWPSFSLPERRRETFPRGTR